jgi:lysophospholipase L1-like esterase
MTRSKTTILMMELFVLLLCLSGCTRQTRADIAFAEVTQKSHSAVVPKPQDLPWSKEWWMPRHDAIKERVAQGNVDLILIGDSLTHSLDQQFIWDQYFAPRNAVNMGFNGDYTQHVLWRLDNGEIDGISPKLAIVLIGSNNSNRSDYTAEEIADGIIAVCAKLRQKLPQTKILLLAIFPRGEYPSPQREKNAKASLLASRIADGKMIHYLDIGSIFLNDDGTISTDIMYDYVHLSDKGKQLWIDAMGSKVDELMGEQ